MKRNPSESITILLKYLDEIQVFQEFSVSNRHEFFCKNRSTLQDIKMKFEQLLPTFKLVKNGVQQTPLNNLQQYGLTGHNVVLQYENFKNKRSLVYELLRPSNGQRDNIAQNLQCIFDIINIFLKILMKELPETKYIFDFNNYLSENLLIK